MSSSNKHWMLGNVGRIMRGFTAKQLMVRVAEEYVWWMLRSLPGFGGVYLRYLFLKLTTRRLDGFCWIGQGCQIFNSYGLSIGRGFATNRNVLIDAIGGIEIGDDTGIGPNCVILSHEHRMLGIGGYQDAGKGMAGPVPPQREGIARRWVEVHHLEPSSNAGRSCGAWAPNRASRRCAVQSKRSRVCLTSLR